LKDFEKLIDSKRFKFGWLKDEIATTYKIDVESFSFNMNVTENETWEFANPVPTWIEKLKGILGTTINDENRVTIN